MPDPITDRRMDINQAIGLSLQELMEMEATMKPVLFQSGEPMNEIKDPSSVTREEALRALLLWLNQLPMSGGYGVHPGQFESMVRLGFAVGTRDDYLTLVPAAALTALDDMKRQRTEFEKAQEQYTGIGGPAIVSGVMSGRIW